LKHRHLWAAATVVWAAALGVYAYAQSGQKSHFSVMAGGYYAREAADREWHVKIVGEIPSLCGAYLVIHDAKGKSVFHGKVPHGKYPEDKPFVVTVKPDGITGDYKIVLCGNQDDLLGVQVPLTDLPFEVYGGTNFSLGHDADAKPWFKGPPGVSKIKLGAYKGQLKVLDKNGGVVADTRQSKMVEKYDNVVEFPITPGESYQIIRETMYFRCATPNTLFLCFDPARWFRPDEALDKVKWWECVPTGVDGDRKQRPEADGAKDE